MNDNDFLKQLIDEGQEIEYKQDVADKDSNKGKNFYRTVSAFSNTNGGYIFLGIEDKTKQLVGIDKTKTSLTKISQTIDSMGVSPRLTEIKHNNKIFIKVYIPKAPFGNLIQYEGIYYIRHHNTTRKMTTEELRIHMRSSFNWEKQENAFTIDDINKRTVEDYQNAMNRTNESIEDTLNRLELMRNGKLTNAAVILFGKNPQKLSPSFSIQIGVFDGNDKANIKKSIPTIKGNIFEQINASLEILKLELIKPTTITGNPQNRRGYYYPEKAIREALINAIVHRDYNDIYTDIQINIFDDYIWFYNTGMLVGGITVDELLQHPMSRARNPLIRDTLYMIGLVERYGSGINRMRDECRKQGIPEPEFSEEQNGFSVRMYKEYKGINSRQIKALEYLRTDEKKFITNSIYRELNGVDADTSKYELTSLVNKGILRIEGIRRYTKYFLK